MRFRVERERLAEVVSWGTRCASATPDLDRALLRLSAGELAVASFDGESSARATTPVEVSDDAEVSDGAEVSGEAGSQGSALVPAELLVEITKALPEQVIDVELTPGVLWLRCGAGRFGLPTTPVEDYPRLPVLPAPAGTVDAAVFGAAVAQVAVAASREEALPILTSVRVAIDGERITLLASDRYRAARREVTWQPVDPKRSTEVLVPGRALLAAAEAFADVPGALTVTVDEDAFDGGTIGFAAGSRQLTVRLLLGTFPQVGRLFEVAHPVAATVSVAELTEVVERVGLFGDRTSPVLLRLGPGTLTVETRGAHGAQAGEEIEAEFVGEPTTLAFNESYLLDGLRGIGGPNVRLSFLDPLKPVAFRAVDAADSAYVLQPVRVDG